MILIFTRKLPPVSVAYPEKASQATIRQARLLGDHFRVSRDERCHAEVWALSGRQRTIESRSTNIAGSEYPRTETSIRAGERGVAASRYARHCGQPVRPGDHGHCRCGGNRLVVRLPAPDSPLSAPPRRCRSDGHAHRSRRRVFDDGCRMARRRRTARDAPRASPRSTIRSRRFQ